jgi:hypothetical protein
VKRYGSKIGVLRRKSRSPKRTLHLPPLPRHPSLPPQLPSPPSPLMSLPPRTPPRMLMSIRFHHHPAHPPSPRSSVRRPSRHHAHLRVLHGNLNLSLRPPPATRSISSISNTMLPPLVLPPRPAPPRTVSVGALFLYSASSRHKSSRHSRCRLQLSHHLPRIRPLHSNITIMLLLRSPLL